MANSAFGIADNHTPGGLALTRILGIQTKLAPLKTATVMTSAVVDTTFVDIYVDTKNIPTCRYNIQHIDKRTKEQ